jgi:hypothetical protein
MLVRWEDGRDEARAWRWPIFAVGFNASRENLSVFRNSKRRVAGCINGYANF